MARNVGSCIEETGKTLDINNQDIVKYLCGIDEERNNLEVIIQKQYKERRQIEAEIERLTYKLCLINKSLSMRIKAKNNYDKTIDEIKEHYEQLVEGSHKLKQIVEQTQQELDTIMNKKTETKPEEGECKMLYCKKQNSCGEKSAIPPVQLASLDDECPCETPVEPPTKEKPMPAAPAPLVKKAISQTTVGTTDTIQKKLPPSPKPEAGILAMQRHSSEKNVWDYPGGDQTAKTFEQLVEMSKERILVDSKANQVDSRAALTGSTSIPAAPISKSIEIKEESSKSGAGSKSLTISKGEPTVVKSVTGASSFSPSTDFSASKNIAKPRPRDSDDENSEDEPTDSSKQLLIQRLQRPST